MSQGAILLTVNRRLSTYMQDEFAKQQKGVWQRPPIFPWQTWLGNLLETYQWRGLSDHRLLTQEQSLKIWQTCIYQSSKAMTLNNTLHLAKQAQQAWNLLNQWQVDFTQLETPVKEVQQFLHWRESYVSQCEKKHWLDNASMGAHVLNLLQQYPLSFPENIHLLGFDEIPPLMENILEALQEVQIHRESMASINQDTHLLKVKDQKTEILLAARYARELYNQNPEATLAIVVPDLTSRRGEIENIFKQIFLGLEGSPYNIAAGQPLAHYTIVHHALNLLELNDDMLSQQQCTQLLLSPFILHAQEEQSPRHLLDVEMRRSNKCYWSWASFMAQAQETCPHLAQCLSNFKQVINNTPETAKPSEWAEHFSQALQALGWPGSLGLNSEEYQVVKRWLELLNTLGQLDLVKGAISHYEAYMQLRFLAEELIFQVKTPRTPIQILGLLETAGQYFQHLWLMGMEQQTWPQAASPNPFIPIQLQQQLDIPHSSAQREYEFAEITTKRLVNSAQTTLVSYATQIASQPCQPSCLVSHYKSIDSLPLCDFEPPERVLFQAKQLESWQDQQAPCVPKNEKIRGGTGILKDQSACPFRAFAHYRLHARGLETPTPGLDPMQRGLLIHKMLELVWQRLQSQEVLLSMPHQQLTDLLRDSTQAALDKYISEEYQQQNPRMLHIEQKRLIALCEQWLALERKRPPFKVIAQEKWQSMDLGQLTLSVQLDRMDELAQGSKVIIDYKTGRPNPQQWFGQRPDEPQLPLYLVAQDENIDALAFAILRPEELSFKGISKEENCIPQVNAIHQYKDIPQEWDALVSEWKNRLTQLAQDFMQGKAQVNPKKPPYTCQYCELHSLCRVSDYAYNA